MAESAQNGPDSIVEPDLTGRTLGNYYLLRRLGRGAMAEVYLAEQQTLSRHVAVKVLKSELARDQTYIERFNREAQAAASLVHANIVQIYEVGCDDGIHYIAQEYVQGQNLHQHLERHGPLEVAKSVSIMRQVAAALAKAADRGIVHRDIKPENIMLSHGGEVKVADFGLARLTGHDAATSLTQIGITMGTPLYMSPEQAEGKKLDPRSDIYSFGVTAYQMLTGSPPFEGDTALAVAVQHVNSTPQPLEEIRRDLPIELCRIVHAMLAKDPNERYAHPRQLLRDLRALNIEGVDEFPVDEAGTEDTGQLAGADATAAAQAAATQHLAVVMQRTASNSSRRRAWWLAGAAIAAVLLGGSVGWMLREPYLLDVDPESYILRQPNARSQWFYASTIGTEAAWLSVIDYYPDETYYCRRAQQQLARLYLNSLEYDKALAAFQELANLGDAQPEFRAFGLAGWAIVLSLQDKHQESAQIMGELFSLRRSLEDPAMREMLRFAADKNRTALAPLNPELATQLERWREELEVEPSD
jgi:serine/threonine-protein kinase